MYGACNGHNSLGFGTYKQEVDVHQRKEYHKALASEGSAKFRCWHRIISTLISRGITNKLDVLPALSGLAQQMQKNGAGRYCAGIWTDDLPSGLLWCFPAGSVYERMRPYRAPTWSWASVEVADRSNGLLGGGSMSLIDFGNGGDEVKCTIDEIECAPSGMDPLGSVSGGHLKLSSPGFEARHSLESSMHWISSRTGEPGHHELGPWILDGVLLQNNAKGSTISFKIHLDIPPSQLTQAGVFHCSVLGHQGGYKGRYYGIALELKETDDTLGTFERVGYFEIPDRITGSTIDQLEIRTFIIR